MESQIDQGTNGHNGENRKRRSGSSRAFFKCGAGSLGLQVAGRFKQQQADGGESGRTASVENSLQRVNAEGIRQRNLVLAGDEHGTDRLGHAPEKEQRAESGEIHGINIPEIGGSDVGLERLPAQSANGITSIDRKERKQQIEVIDATNRRPQAGAAELAELQRMASVIEKEGYDQGQQKQ